MPEELQTVIKKTQETLSKLSEGAAPNVKHDVEQLLRELSMHHMEMENQKDDLQRRLEEAEQTIEAIRNGEVDAVVRSDKDGTRIYTLEGPDRPYQKIVETMNAGAVTIDLRGTIFYSNCRFSEMTGIPLENLIGSSFENLVVPEDLPLFIDFLDMIRETKNTTEQITRMKGRKAMFYSRLLGSSHTVADIERVCIVITDVSALKAAEHSSRKANERLLEEARERAKVEEHLQQAQKLEAIGTLAGGIAHDFNNMLAVVMGNAELALDEINGNEAPRRNIEQIVKASKRARDLVKQILTFSRKTERRRKPLKLAPLLKETYGLLRGSLPTTITINLDIQTKSDTVITDPSEVQQILMNLATNALHAIGEKSGTLTIGLSNVTLAEDGPLPDREMSAGSYVKLMVRDTGKGMTDKTRSRIFEPFFTTKPSGQGTGMGLAVVYGIVKSHRGAITVESEPGKGSTFVVFLPRAVEQAKEEAKEGGRALHGNERILLVDDEPFVLEMTSQMLNNLGYHVTTAQTGIEALNIFLAEPSRFDCVITDQTMPEMTGIDLSKKVLETRSDLPVILFTGYSEAVSAEQAKAAGIREFVMKPISKREIANTVRRVLDAE